GLKREPWRERGQPKVVGREEENRRIRAIFWEGLHPATDFFGVPVDAVNDVQSERQLAIVSPPAEHADHARKWLCDRFVLPNATVGILLAERSPWVKLWCIQLVEESIDFLP